MAQNNTRQLTIRLNDQTYKTLKMLALNRGESMTVVSRRILTRALQSETALEASDILIAAVRNVMATELRQTEKRLANISSKGAIAAATAENLVTYLVKNMIDPNVKEVRDAARSRGVAYIREPLESIMSAYPAENKEGGND